MLMVVRVRVFHVCDALALIIAHEFVRVALAICSSRVIARKTLVPLCSPLHFYISLSASIHRVSRILFPSTSHWQ